MVLKYLEAELKCKTKILNILHLTFKKSYFDEENKIYNKR